MRSFCRVKASLIFFNKHFSVFGTRYTCIRSLLRLLALEYPIYKYIWQPMVTNITKTTLYTQMCYVSLLFFYFFFSFFSTIYLNVFVTSVCQLLQHQEPVMIRTRYILWISSVYVPMLTLNSEIVCIPLTPHGN